MLAIGSAQAGHERHLQALQDPQRLRALGIFERLLWHAERACYLNAPDAVACAIPHSVVPGVTLPGLNLSVSPMDSLEIDTFVWRH